MSRFPRLSLTFVLVGLLALQFAGCGDDATPSDPSDPTGAIVVDASPDALNAPWSLSGPGGYSFDGTGDRNLAGLALGEYTIAWGDVDGWSSPPGATRTLGAGGTVTFSGAYVEIVGTGSVIVDPTPDAIDAPWTLAGPKGYTTSGAGDRTLADLDVGYYRLTWGDVSGWVTPAAETQALAADAVVTFTGTYVEEPATGTVVIDAQPDALSAPWTLAGPNGFSDAGNGDRNLTALAPGDYTVAWGDVSGWTRPAGETLTLSAGGTVTFTGVYTEIPAGGAIVVDHRAVLDFDAGNIPAVWIEEVKAQGILIHIPGRSHAQQLVGDMDDPSGPSQIGGLLTLENMDPTYNVEIRCDLADLPASGALRIVKGQYDPQSGGLITSTPECRFDDSEYWATETGRGYTEFTAAYAVQRGDRIDASIFGWSYHILKPGATHDESGGMITFNDERRNAYLNAMQRFNNHASGTVFVYGTTPVDDGYSPNTAYLTTDGLRVTLYNRDFRDAAVAAGAILWDQADIENWNSDFTDRRTDTYNGQELQLRHTDWDGGDCVHGGMGICVAKAKALWWLAARLAGWDGTPAQR